MDRCWAALRIEEVEAASEKAAPVMADRDDLAGFFDVEGFLDVFAHSSIVVQPRIGGFRRTAVPEKVRNDELAVQMGQLRHDVLPDMCAIGPAMEQEERRLRSI